MENENNFKETVSSLFKGMDGFVSAKTVVGDAIHVGDTIILPLVDVSRRKDDPMRSSGNPEWYHQACKRKEPGWSY